MNTIAPISFRRRIKIAKDDKTVQDFKNKSNELIGISSMASAMDAGLESLNTTSMSTHSSSLTPACMLGVAYSPEITSNIIANPTAGILICGTSAAVTGKIGYDKLNKEIPSDKEENNDNKTDMNIEEEY